jgi:hypothetical protein
VEMTEGQQETSATPVTVRFGDRLWRTWKGQGDDTRIFISSCSGSTWTEGDPIPEIRTGAPPALASMGSELFLIWWDEHDNTIHWAKTCNGIFWDLQDPLPDRRSTTVETATGLYLAWKAKPIKSRRPARKRTNATAWPFSTRPFLVPRAK